LKTTQLMDLEERERESEREEKTNQSGFDVQILAFVHINKVYLFKTSEFNKF
jgi:hypothetical protein